MSAAGAEGAAATDARPEEYEEEDEYDGENEDEGEVLQPALGRPHVHLRNTRPLVRDDEHCCKTEVECSAF